MKEQYTVGQTLWFVSRNRSSDRRQVMITQIGRKWMTLNNGRRIDKDTLIADGGDYVSPGRCYLSEAEYNAKVKLDAAWVEFKQRLGRQHNPPPGMTVEKIQAAQVILCGEAQP